MKDAIRISVKGGVTDAQRALVARGVTGVLVAEGRFGTFWDVPATAIAKVVAWHCEPAVCSEETGFPAGTLLHHG
jgi:hypothetical protein